MGSRLGALVSRAAADPFRQRSVDCLGSRAPSSLASLDPFDLVFRVRIRRLYRVRESSDRCP